MSVIDTRARGAPEWTGFAGAAGASSHTVKRQAMGGPAPALVPNETQARSVTRDTVNLLTVRCKILAG